MELVLLEWLFLELVFEVNFHLNDARIPYSYPGHMHGSMFSFILTGDIRTWCCMLATHNKKE